MTDIITEREIVTQVLKLYRKCSCLWDTSNVYYFNKSVRNDSYEKMLEIWHKLYPMATVSDLKKKLEHFRTSYRREKKKVESSAVNSDSSEKVYVPSLWYYKYLTFLNTRSEQKDSSDDDVEKVYAHAPTAKKRRISQSTEIHETNGRNDDKDKCNSEDYTTVYGLTIARQLKELDESVRFEAERLISEVIYRARTGSLPKYTSQIVDSFGIPQSGPSWYEMPLEDAGSQKNTNTLIVTVNETSEQNIKTEVTGEEII